MQETQGSIPGSGRSPGEGHGNPLQYSCLENPMDRGAWDSPGKNTGVGCHVLLQCMKVKSESEVAQSCPTDSSRPHGLQPTRLLRPWDFPGQEYWSGFPLPSPQNAAAAAKSLQSCLILCDPRDGSPPGSPVPGHDSSQLSSMIIAC